MIGETSIVSNSDKEKWVYSGYGIVFDRAGSSNFVNEFAKNVVTFGVDNSSWSHADNHKKIFLVLGEGPTYGINGNFGSPEFSINFSKANTKFCLSLHYICLLMEKKSISLKPIIKMSSFQLNFI